VVVEGLFRIEFLVAVRTRIYKQVWVMNCFNVIPHTGGGLVRKLAANSTSGNVFPISGNKVQQVGRVLYVS